MPKSCQELDVSLKIHPLVEIMSSNLFYFQYSNYKCKYGCKHDILLPGNMIAAWHNVYLGLKMPVPGQLLLESTQYCQLCFSSPKLRS